MVWDERKEVLGVILRPCDGIHVPGGWALSREQPELSSSSVLLFTIWFILDAYLIWLTSANIHGYLFCIRHLLRIWKWRHLCYGTAL